VDVVEDRRVLTLLRLAETLRQGVAEVAVDDELLRRLDVAVVVALGENEVDRGAGAIAWEYSTSRLISPAQLVWSAFDWSNGVNPSGAMMFSFGAGRPNVVSKLARSCVIVGLWKASTMTIVSPLPFRPALASLSTP